MKEQFRRTPNKRKEKPSKNCSKENYHHIIHKRDKNRVPKTFDINAESNKVMLPIKVHNELHHLIDTSIYRNDLTTRVYFANMAYNDDLSDIPDRMYRTMVK